MHKLIYSILVYLLFVQFTTAQTKDGKVRGQVLDAGNIPVEAADVMLEGTAYHTITGADGSFIITAPAGHYSLTIRRVGFKKLHKSINIKAGEETAAGNINIDRSDNMQEVEVAGKTQSQQLRTSGYQMSVIDMKSQYNTSRDLNQVLNQTTGVRIREEGGLGSNFTFSLNGFSGNQVKFFLDGLPMDNFGSSLTLNNFPTNIAERIEVYKGVLPVSLGTDALGGAVNIITRSNQNYLDASYSYGSFNTHRPAISAAYTNAKTGFTVRLNTFYNYSDNDYKVLVPVKNLTTNSYDGTQQWVKRFHDKYESATAQLELGVVGKKYADKLLLGLIASENNKDIQTGVTMDAVYGAMKSKSHSFIPTLKYKKSDLFIKGLEFNLYSAYNSNNFQLIDTTPRNFNWLGQSVQKSSSGSSSVGGEVNRTTNENKNREWLNNASFVYRINDWQTLALNDIFSTFKRTSYDAENPDVYTNRFPSKLIKNTVGLAWNADVKGKWITAAFVKYYAMKAVGYQQVNPLTDSAHYESTSFHYSQPGYGIASGYFVLPSLEVKASYEHAYRMPESDEIFGDGVFVVYSPGLKPERSENVNLGLRFNKVLNNTHKIGAEAGGIYRDTKDFIRVDQSTSGGNRQTVNQGRVQTTGAEGELSYAYKGRFFASVNGTYQRLVDEEKYQKNNGYGGGVTRNFTYGFRLPNIPYLFGNFNAGANFPIKTTTLTLNYSLNYVQHYYLTFAELGTVASNAAYIIPEQWAHNVYATWSLAKGKYNISAECRNLTNNLLYDSYRLQKPGRSFTIKLRYFISK
jgi:outer membrane cobalamin receptor